MYKLLFINLLPFFCYCQVYSSFSGKASYYGKNFHGKYTASGEIFDMNAMTAAHRTLPLHTVVRVTNKKNNRTVTVKINDRGPVYKGFAIDLSKGAASKLDMIHNGVVPVLIEIIKLNKKVDKKLTRMLTNDYLSVKSSSKKNRSATIKKYYVQIAAFASYKNALNFHQTMKDKALQQWFIKKLDVNGKTLFGLLVLVSGKEAGNKLKEKLKLKGYNPMVKFI